MDKLREESEDGANSTALQYGTTDFEGDQPFGSPLRVFAGGGDPTSFMPALMMERR